MLSLVRSTKNTFAPVNRIPPDVLVLIPHHCDTYKDSITLTHVCRGWREILTCHPPLWTVLDCADINKTRSYLERSKTCPLEISLEEGFLNDAFLLTVPHLHRLGALTLSWSSDSLFELTKHLGSPAPFLKKLKLVFTNTRNPVIKDAIFNGDLSSLHELRLSGVIANLAWRNMANLRTFDLRRVPSNNISVTQLLDFFECAPLLRKVILRQALPSSSNAPPRRVASLPNLKFLILAAQPAHTILLNHLLIPAGASVCQEFNFSDSERSPIPPHIPKTLENFKNLSKIAFVNLHLSPEPSLRLKGSSGEHYMFGSWVGEGFARTALDGQVLLSLKLFCISTTEGLMITNWRDRPSPSQRVNKSSVYLAFLLVKNLRTLSLINCLNLPFLLALNPEKNPQKAILCPKLEDLVIHVEIENWFYINEVLEMAKERASKGIKL